MSNLFMHKEDEKIQKAYENLKSHINKYEDFDSFRAYFNSITAGKDSEFINEYLLRILYMIVEADNFETLLDLADEKKKQELNLWLKNSIAKLRMGV